MENSWTTRANRRVSEPGEPNDREARPKATVVNLHGLIEIEISPNFPGRADWLSVLTDVMGVSPQTAGVPPSKLVVDRLVESKDHTRRELRHDVLVDRHSLLDREYGTLVQFPAPGVVALQANNQCLEWMSWGLQLAALASRACFVHSAGIERDGRAVLLPSWGGVGKTAIVASFVKAGGWRVLGDDLVILSDDGTVHAFPKPMVVYPYHKAVLPAVFSEGRGPLAPTHLNRFFGMLGSTIKPTLRRIPAVLAFARRHNPQSTRVLPSQVFGIDKLAGSARLDRVIWLERVRGLRSPEFVEDHRLCASRIVGSTLSEYDSRCVGLSHVAMGLGLLTYERFFGAWYDVVSAATKDRRLSALYLPLDHPLPAVADLVFRAVNDVG